MRAAYVKVLLTGAGGFLGSRVAAALKVRGEVSELRLQVRQRMPAELLDDPKVRAVAVNLLSRPDLPELVQGVDTIVHAAAGMRGAGPDMFLNTVVASRNLIAAAAAAGVRRLVLVSSFAVYRTADLPRNALVDEATPLESSGFEKGEYGYTKLRQERLLQDEACRGIPEVVIVRPGVIYGPGGGAFSPRVGLQLGSLFVSLGGSVTLPLTYVDNCADAIVTATLHAPSGAVFNVVDEDLPSCNQYLERYRQEVRPLRRVPIPYPLIVFGAGVLERYHKRSLGQLPSVFSPYVVRSMFRNFRYSNAGLRRIGWEPRVSIDEGLARTFAAFSRQQR